MPQPTAETEYKSDVLAEADQVKDKDQPDYSDDEIKYIGGLQTRLERAFSQRNQQRSEFDGMTYIQYWEANEKGANTLLQPKQNREDSNFQSGTIRQKLLALLAALENLDLSGDVHAFDENELEINSLGDAIEDTMEKVEELDNDAEKKTRRQYELLKQGDVFVETIWDEKYIKDKKLQSKTFDGKIKGVNWTTKVKRYFARPVRNIISGLSVFLGDMTIYDIADQPYIFTVEIKGYGETKAQFEKWERWKYVTREVRSIVSVNENSIVYNNWRLTELQKDHCEIIRYQDKWNNEYALIINGVLMTPIGLPLPWGYCDYNIVQQGLSPIHEKFSYHESIVKRLKNNVAIYDEMMKLAVLKTQKSFLPPYLNYSGQIISRRVFMPAAITAAGSLNKGDLQPVSDLEVQGVTQSEFNFIHELQDNLDKQSVNPVFQGQNPKGDTTATEVLEVQRQAKLMMGLTVAAASLLEWKLDWQMLYVLLQKWFEPVDDKLDAARNKLVDVYRKTNVAKPIPGAGMGRRVTVPTKELPSKAEVTKLNQYVSKKTGVPHRFTFLDPDYLKNAKIIWQIVVRAREKRTSEISKLLFQSKMQGAQMFGPDLNLPHLEEEFANVWDDDPSKLFKQGQPATPATPGTSPTAPSVVPPSPTQALGKSLKNSLGQ